MYDVVQMLNNVPSIIATKTASGSLFNVFISPDEGKKLADTTMVCSPFRAANDKALYELDLVEVQVGPRAGQAGVVQFTRGCFLVRFQEKDEAGEYMEFLADYCDRVKVMPWDERLLRE